MTFLHPLHLWAAGAAAVPLVLHLLLRRRATTVSFGSLALLRLLQRRTARRMRLAQILLMLLRMAAAVTAGLLFAQPVFEGGPLAALNGGPERLVILADTSRSLGLRDEAGRSLMERVAAAVGDALAGADARSEVVVVALAPRARVVFRGDPGRFDAALLGVSAPSSPDLQGASELTAALLRDTPLARRRVVVVSDFQTVPWQRGLPVLKEALGPLLLHRVHTGVFSTWALASVAASERTAVVGVPVVVQVEAAWSSEGRLPAPGRLLASCDGRVLASVPLEVPAGGGPTGSLVLSLPVVFRDEGERRLDLTVDDDSLPADGRAALAFRVVTRRRVLLLSGDPRPAAVNDECFFLRRAVAATESGVEVRELRQRDLPEGEALEGSSAVHAAAWAPSSEGEGERLRRYVAGGGTLVVWGGDHLDPAAATERLLRPLGGLELGDTATTPSRWRSCPEADTPLNHLVPADFVAPMVSRRYRFVRELPRAGAPSRVAVRLEDGTPLLVAAPSGEGHLVFVNASADTEWSDLPLHPLFAVLVDALPRLTSTGLRRLRPGERFVLPVTAEASAAPAAVRTPDGRKLVVPARWRDGVFELVVEDTFAPGVYEVDHDAARGAGPLRFEVGPDGAEASLEYVPDAVLATHSSGGAASGALPVPLRTADLLLLALGALLVAEGLVLAAVEKALRAAESGPRER